MPGNSEHSLDTRRRLKVEASDLHAWMDEESRALGASHRLLRHDPENPPEFAVRRYGLEVAKAVMRCHVELDGYDQFRELRALAVAEKLESRRRNMRESCVARVSEVEGDLLTLSGAAGRFRAGDEVGLVGGEAARPLGFVLVEGPELTLEACGDHGLRVGEDVRVCRVDDYCYDLQIGLVDRIIGDSLLEGEQRVIDRVLVAAQVDEPRRIGGVDGARPGGGRMDASQLAVVEAARGLAEGELLLVVGPPGTGKTEVIARAASELVSSGERVLISSHTNRAVDNALVKLPVEMCVRVGQPDRLMREALRYTLGSRSREALGDELTGLESGIEGLRDRLREMPTYIGREEEARMLRGSLRDLRLRRAELIKHEQARLLSEAKVVGATLLRLSLPPLSKMVFDTIFVDECSQVSTTLALMGLLRARKWVLIGDHKQLLPIFKSLGDAPKRELEELSAFTSLMAKHPRRVMWLRTHYRSNSEIIGFARRCVYEDKIVCDARCREIRLTLKDPPRYLAAELPVVFVDVEGMESRDLLSSTYNEAEAEASMRVIDDLVDAGVKPRDIGVITPFRAQGRLIRKRAPRGVEVNTVDSFQGQEKDVIIYSVAATRGIEFAEDPNRLNVAVTRAKKKLIVIANRAKVEDGEGLLGKYVEYVGERGGVFYYDRSTGRILDGS